MLKNKILLVLAAALLCAQGAVAGGNPRKSGINGIYLPVLDAVSRAAGALYYSWEGDQDGLADPSEGDDDEGGGAGDNSGPAPSPREDVLYYYTNDDDGNEESPAPEVKNETPEVDAEEKAVALLDLPPEMQRMIVEVGNPSDQGLAALCASCTTMRYLFRHDLEVRKVRKMLALLKEGKLGSDDIIEAFYTLKDAGKKVYADFVSGVLAILMNDGVDADIRFAITKAIGGILASGAANEDERGRLLGVLIGENGQPGLLEDGNVEVQSTAFKAIGVILASGTLDADERWRLLRALVGEDGHGGLRGDQNWPVRGAVARAIGDILATGNANIDERGRWAFRI